MDKIEANKQRGRPLKKEVKSRVLQGLGTSTSSTASTSSTRPAPGDANNNANHNKDKRWVIVLGIFKKTRFSRIILLVSIVGIVPIETNILYFINY